MLALTLARSACWTSPTHARLLTDIRAEQTEEGSTERVIVDHVLTMLVDRLDVLTRYRLS